MPHSPPSSPLKQASKPQSPPSSSLKQASKTHSPPSSPLKQASKPHSPPSSPLKQASKPHSSPSFPLKQASKPHSSPPSPVKQASKFDAEFRRFAITRSCVRDFQEFYRLIQTVHKIPSLDIHLVYTDIQGDLLPINNDDNYQKALRTANPLLRVIIQRRIESENSAFASNSLQRKKKSILRTTQPRTRPPLLIGTPQNFRQISSIIDVDILPETHRRVRLHKHGSEKPLGFYIRDGVSIRVSPGGVEKVPGVFISRLVKGGVAESTGLLAVSDEILEVNGIDIAGKSLDQVTDMMVANSHKLILTVKPANQRNNVIRTGKASSVDSAASPVSCYTNSYNTAEGGSDEDGDVVIERDCSPVAIHTQSQFVNRELQLSFHQSLSLRGSQNPLQYAHIHRNHALNIKVDENGIEDETIITL
uniref:Uncharacterized protein n=1 Tax=Leptobrachium leishanense TaxID=445787 RepID=A0A8C5MYK1_9ANUR